MVFHNVVKNGFQRNRQVKSSQLDTLLRSRVSQNNDLIQFLHALTDERFDKSVPASVPSGLPVGGRL